ncbi:MAG: T9SS C-terminal target domain-containing protein [Cryomorphaceae bacterium]|nr:MAG: T9SS C-terminal target domain-containing protein [Cryomorphaceae bacterium]
MGGTTGEEACTADCNGDFGGTAFIDNCDNCVGGNTGNEPCDPQTDCELSYSYTTVPATLGFANGAATIMVTGGQEPYSYQWNDAFMQTEPELLGVFAGTYMCVVQDAAGCEEAFSVDVPFADNVPTTQVHPNFCNTGGYELGDFISATSIPSAQAYRWEFTPVGGAPLPEYTRSTNNPWIRIAWIDGVALAQTYQVRVKVLVNGVWGEYGNICTISTSNTIPLTELRPEYHGSNGGGEPYALCDIMIAYSVSGATNYRWRIDPDNDPNNGNEIYYVRGSSNPGARLSWIGGLQPGQQYHVAVEAAVGDVWAGFGAVHSISLGSPAITAVRPNFCGVTFASVSGLLIAQSVCSADYYEWEFVNTTTGITSTAQRPNTGISLNWNGISPPLEPGEIEIRVRVQQEGVLGDFGPVCNIAIEGPGMPVPDVASLKSAIQENTVIYPNPSSGNEVRLELSGLDEGNHHVAIHVYDVHGKLLLNDGFGHTGSVVSRLIRFNQSLSKGMYMVHVVVDGERFVTEKLVVH